MVLCVRPAPGVPVTAADLRHAVQDAAPEAPLFDVQTLEARFAGHLARERRLAALLVPPEQPASASPRWGCWL